ncbi:helix-turn-helix domain-containing protein [Stakelama pacifica]|uniref:DNA-binding CsgD family transcriptional regulator n=1 Tax=Stakelama pacifica TaxID=517720 RepID=A0A4R6FUQ5_9SPHN|nr:DUF4019 domain-containing protein [Stakelama pacifica]TDN85609.1 DNA-binding CsgD family transcriptional regulator [Stakelama pacifica]GGO92145.1 hypothetical protein GCM10011329_08530 [Stakelama pacifica]
MTERIESLTEREKEALRLLLAGHDTKSVATTLDLSVHTINDRLRDARKKLGVSSSREAARMLGQAEAATPQLSGRMKIGMADAPTDPKTFPPSQRRPAIGLPLVWLGGGMLIMSLIIATLVFTALPSQNAARPPAAEAAAAQSDAIAANAPAVTAARDWLALMDKGAWGESWSEAGSLFREQVTQARWTDMAKAVSGPLGKVTARAFKSGKQMNALPGAPKGDYAMVQFATDFAHRAGATETVVLAKQADGWKVIGYFIQ